MLSHEEAREDFHRDYNQRIWQEKQARLALNPSECQYLDILRKIKEKGERKVNRTGIDTFAIPHTMVQHDMAMGFPLITTKKMAFKSMKVELEGFIKGITDKKWFQERGCHIWDEWCNPEAMPKTLIPLTPEETKAWQASITDLGPIYGSQWRKFNGKGHDFGGDQLQNIVDKLKSNPNDRRMVCSAWNPLVLHEQALPPCHVLWHVTVINGKLNLCWFQRSCDFFLGIPFNIASYGLLLHLLAKQSGLKEGILTGFFSDSHLYANHIDAVNEQLKREPFPCPTVETKKFKSIFEWEAGDTVLTNYKCHAKIAGEVAI